MARTLCLLLLVLCVSGLLLPPLARLHAQAPSDLGVCMGNLKQIGMAVRLYLADYNDTFPVANEGDPGRAHGIVQDKYGRHPIYLRNALANYLVYEEVWWCPAQRKRSDMPKKADTDYGYMCGHDRETFLGKALAQAGVSPDQCMVCGRPLSAIKTPATTAMVFCNKLGVHAGVSEESVELQGGPGATTVCFVDGHVEYVRGTATELIGRILTGK